MSVGIIASHRNKVFLGQSLQRHTLQIIAKIQFEYFERKRELFSFEYLSYFEQKK